MSCSTLCIRTPWRESKLCFPKSTTRKFSTLPFLVLGNEIIDEKEIAPRSSRNSSAEGYLAWQDGLLPQVLNHQVIQRLQNVLSVGAHP